MKSLLAMSIAAFLLAALPTLPASANVADGIRRLNFDVFLDDRAIGYQRFALTPAPDGTRIETQAEFKVKLLLVTAFAYDHRNTELWRDGCLQAIDARTDSNGERSAVSGRARDGAFVVATGAGERRLDDCVASFAYWDRDVLLERQRLLNSQTGEYTRVRIQPLGLRRVRTGGRDLDVERFAIRGQDIDIDIDYAAGSGEWVALDTRLKGGRTLRYRRSSGGLSLPQTAQATPATGARR
jgi:hypothetical protein